jgi:hypothetical protein
MNDSDCIKRYRAAFPEHATMKDEQIIAKLDGLRGDKRLLDAWIESHHHRIRRINYEDLIKQVF